MSILTPPFISSEQDVKNHLHERNCFISRYVDNYINNDTFTQAFVKNINLYLPFPIKIGLIPLMLPIAIGLGSFDDYKGKQHKKRMLDVWDKTPQYHDIILSELKHRYLFSHGIEEELVAYVCHPKNYEKFETLGFFDES